MASFYIFFFALLFSTCHAYTFNVGGKDGWILHPSENYNQWSSRLRFILNATLHFKYNAGSDSVLVVNNGDYDNCNTNNPITTLTGGDSFFNLNRTGPFYFISGNKTNCDQGQKLKLVVITPKKKAGFPLVPTGSPVASASPPESGTSVPTSPAASPGGGTSSSPTGSPTASSGGGTSTSSPPARSPVANSPGGGPSSSPTGNLADVNAMAPGGSPSSSSARVAVSATLTLFVGMIMFGFINLFS